VHTHGASGGGGFAGRHHAWSGSASQKRWLKTAEVPHNVQCNWLIMTRNGRTGTKCSYHIGSEKSPLRTIGQTLTLGLCTHSCIAQQALLMCGGQLVMPPPHPPRRGGGQPSFPLTPCPPSQRMASSHSAALEAGPACKQGLQSVPLKNGSCQLTDCCLAGGRPELCGTGGSCSAVPI
jgi:hypothetical protein